MRASIRPIRNREDQVWWRCEAEVNTMRSGSLKTSRRMIPAAISVLRRACQTRNGRPAGGRRKVATREKGRCGTIGPSGTPVVATGTDRACTGRTRIIVEVIPERRRLKFGAITATAAASTNGRDDRESALRRTPSSAVFDIQDLERARAARRGDLHGIALRLADESARDRRRDRNLARLHVGFDVADDLVLALLIGVLVDQHDGGAEGDSLAGELRDIDDF